MNNLAEPFNNAATRISATATDGPLTRRLLRRTSLAYITLCIAGLLPWLLDGPAFWQAAGLGLLWPGAGFVAVGGWSLLLIPVTLALFAVALFAWFASAMVIAPVIIWLGSALLAGALADAAIWTPGPYIAGAVAVLWQIRSRVKKSGKIKAAVARLQERNAYLPAAVAALPAQLSARPHPDDREMSAEQLAAMRYLFDRALQPVGQLEGFDHIEQFQPSALRYQLNQVGYALALAQCQYTPSFHGYLSQAQRNLIEQSLDAKIWNYWRYERLWGKLSLNDDPAGDDNIMLTGFLGLQVALYAGNTGDQRYGEPGSLSFKRGGKVVHAHDLHSIIGSVVRNFDEQPYCLYPCEPNWVYTFCNFRGMTSLFAYDRACGTTYAQDRLPRYMHQLDSEFTTPDGSLYALKSNLTGIAVAFPGGGDEGTVLSFNVLAPERAKRAWAMTRHETMNFIDGKPELIINEKGLDFGNYKKSPITQLYQTLCAAREMGDDAVADAALERLNSLCELDTKDGRYQWKGSTMANATAIMGLLMRRDDWRSTIVEGPSPEVLRGPILTEASYPDVLVAKARSHGEDLDLVLYPGRSQGAQTIKIERLQPGRRYQVVGDQPTEFSADNRGTAQLQIHLAGRTALSVRPLPQ